MEDINDFRSRLRIVHSVLTHHEDIRMIYLSNMKKSAAILIVLPESYGCGNGGNSGSLLKVGRFGIILNHQHSAEDKDMDPTPP